MRLKILRPIVFFDLETTGTRIDRDRIIQMAMLKISPGKPEHEVRTFLVNPGMPIPPAATAVHGITDDAVRDLPQFQARAKEVAGFLDGCDLGGFNVIRFDLPLLSAELSRCGIAFPAPDVRVVDAQTIFHRKEQRTLSAAMKFYCGREHAGAHDAEADIRATVDVFTAQLDRYTDLADDVDGLNTFCEYDRVVDLAGKFTRGDDGQILYNFGQHKGKPVATDPGYLEWMLRQDFPEQTKVITRKLLNEMKGSS